MMRRFNYRFFLCLIAILAVSAAATNFVHAFQVKRTASFLLQQAEHHEKAGSLPNASIYLGRYLALFPKDAEVRARYGLLLANEKMAVTPRALQQAFAALENALRLDSKRQDVRRRAIEVAMNPMLKHYNDAAAHIDELIKTFDNSDKIDGELLRWRGLCHEAKEEFQDARKCYEGATGSVKKDPEDFLRLASLLRQYPDKVKTPGQTSDEVFRVADQTIEKMLETFKQSARAHLFSAYYYRVYSPLTALSRAMGMLASVPGAGPWIGAFETVANPVNIARERVARDLATALALEPDGAEVLLAAADFHVQRQQPATARKLLAHGIELYPEDWRMYQSASRVEIEDKTPAAAVAVLNQGLAKLPKNLDLLWDLAQLQLRQGNKEEANLLFQRLEAADFPRSLLDYLRGRMYINEEEWGQAARLLEESYPLIVSRASLAQNRYSLNLAEDCLVLLANCWERIGDPERAATVYGQILSRDPVSLAGQLGRARMDWVLGHEDAALSHYRQMTRAPAPVEAWLEYAQLLILCNVKDPRFKDSDWKAAKATWEEANLILDRLASLKPAPVKVALLGAEILLAQGKFDKARDLLLKGYPEDQPRPVEIWVGLANLEQRRGKLDAALAILKEAESPDRAGDKLELRLAKARYIVASQAADKETLDEIAKLGKGVEEWPKADQHRLYAELAEAYARLGQPALAQAAWLQIAKSPSDVGSRMALFDLALQARDDAAMARLVAELKAIEREQGWLWRFCEACRLIVQGHNQTDKASQKEVLDRARTLLAVVEGRRGGWGRVPEARADIDDLLGNTKAAVENYKKAIALGNRNPAVIRRVAQIYAGSGQFLEAGEMLEKLREQTGSFGDLDKVAAQVALAQHDSGRALDIAQKAVAKDSKDYRDHLWLGQVLWAAGKMPEAQAELRLAASLKPDSAEPVVALVQFFVSTGDKGQAKTTLEEAEKNKSIPHEPGLLPLALCHELVGEIDKARELYEEASEVLTAKPGEAAMHRAKAMFHLRQKNERPLAKRELEKLLNLRAASDEEAAQAKRLLAVVMASNGDYAQTKESLEKMGVFEGDQRSAPSAAGEPNLADERAKVFILAQQQNPRQRKRAIDILERIAGLNRITENEQFMLAQLYESVRDYTKSREQMLLLVRAAEENLQKAPKGQEAAKAAALANYFAYYAATLMRQKLYAAAQFQVAALEKLEPGSFRTVSIKARLLAGQAKNQEAGRKEAGRILTELADKKPGELLAPVAAELEAIGLDNEAEKMLRRFVAESQDKSPENVLALAVFLGRHQRPDEGLDLCDLAWKDCKPEAVSRASVTVLYSAKCEPSHWLKVAVRLESACAKNPKNTALLGDLSAVKRGQEDYTAVKMIFRQILELDKDNALTMNNLAWILALKDKDTTEAFQWIQKAIDRAGPKASLLGTRAVIFMKLGKADQAVNDLQQAVEEAPTAINYFHLAQAYWLANNPSAFLSAAHKALELKLDESAVDPLEQNAYREFRVNLSKLEGQ